MKAVISTIVILIIFFMGAIAFQIYIQNACERLIGYVEELDENITNEAWDKAEETFTAFRRQWEKEKRVWTVILEHYNVDSIEIAIARTEKFKIEREKALLLGEVMKLKHLIKHIGDREAFVLSNIL